MILELTNFQAHAKSTIDFASAPITIITGENYDNKSAISKALDIALFGSSFEEDDVKLGTKEGKVTVRFPDGRVIERSRKGATQKTILTDAKGNKKEYTGAKGLIQEELSAFTGFSRVVFDPSSSDKKGVNLQLITTGSDRFMVDSTSPESIMKTISNMVLGQGLENTLTKLRSDLSQVKTEVKIVRNQYDAIVDEIEAFYEEVSYEDIADSFEKTKQCAETFSNLQLTYDNMLALVSNVNLTEDTLVDLENEIDELNTIATEVDDLLSLLDKNTQELKTLAETIKSNAATQADIALSDIDQMLEKLYSYKDEYDKLTSEMEELEKQLECDFKCDKCNRIVKVVNE